MLYVSNKIDMNTIEITDTSTNQVVREPIKTLYVKYHNKVVEGLTYSPKRKQPRIEVTTPILLMLKRIPVGQVILFKRNEEIGYEHCLLVRRTKSAYLLYGGGGKIGFLTLTRSMLVNNKDSFHIDVTHVDNNVASLLKKDYKEYIQTTR